MAGGRALLEQQPLQAGPVVFQKLGRSEIPGDQHRVLGQPARARGLAGEDPEQPVGQILEVVQPLAQIGVARLAEAGAMLGTDAFHRGLGGEAGAHGVLQPPRPAPVVGEHPVGLQHLVGDADDMVAFEHLVDLRAQGLQRRLKPGLFQDGVVGEQLLRCDRRLVQHRLAQG